MTFGLMTERLSNNRVNLTVRAVTPLANSASGAPARSAGYAERYASSPRATMKTIILCLAVAMTVSAHAIEMLLDERMAAKAEVVLRVKLLNPPQGNDKYSWFRVQVLEVLKNTSDEMFKDTCSVAAYSGKKGVPAGESTIYLERYNKATHQLWMLVGGEASTGVSHSSVR